jgi:hypothetical protein
MGAPAAPAPVVFHPAPDAHVADAPAHITAGGFASMFNPGEQRQF